MALQSKFSVILMVEDVKLTVRWKQYFQVIEARESQCVTLALVRATSELCPSANTDKEQVGLDKEKTASGSLTWKLKWFSEESLFKFVALFKAIHAGATMSPLPVRCIS